MLLRFPLVAWKTPEKATNFTLLGYFHSFLREFCFITDAAVYFLLMENTEIHTWCHQRNVKPGISSFVQSGVFGFALYKEPFLKIHVDVIDFIWNIYFLGLKKINNECRFFLSWQEEISGYINCKSFNLVNSDIFNILVHHTTSFN